MWRKIQNLEKTVLEIPGLKNTDGGPLVLGPEGSATCIVTVDLGTVEHPQLKALETARKILVHSAASSLQAAVSEEAIVHHEIEAPLPLGLKEILSPEGE